MAWRLCALLVIIAITAGCGRKPVASVADRLHITPDLQQRFRLKQPVESTPGRPSSSPAVAPSRTSPVASQDELRQSNFIEAPGRQPASSPDTGSATVTLEGVLQSVHEHYPLIDAVLAEREIAEGRLLSAQGAFDLEAQSEAKFKPKGYYINDRANVLLSQPTPFWGITPFVGYRWGWGDFPIYDEDIETNRGGELAVGMNIPLLKGGYADERRTNLWQAEVDRDIAEPTIRSKRLSYFQKASSTYWKWVAAGKKLEIAEELLALAQKRQSQLNERANVGDIPRLSLVDNERLIVDRKAKLAAARRDFQQASIAVSLFLRDPQGDPIYPDDHQVPAAYPDVTGPDGAVLDADLQLAQRLRPEILQHELELERLGLELQLAQNKLLPKTDVTLVGSQDYGISSSEYGVDDAYEFEVGVKFAMPLWLREARGKIREVEAKMTKTRAQLRFAKDQVTADVRDAFSAVVTADEQLEQARQNVVLAQRMEAAERDAFAAGNSDLFRVNIREQQSAGAAANAVSAAALFFTALADYRAALGVDFLPEQMPASAAAR